MKTAQCFIAWAVAGVICSAPVLAQAKWENPVKKLLREGKPVVGLTVTIPSPDVALQAARQGLGCSRQRCDGFKAGQRGQHEGSQDRTGNLSARHEGDSDDQHAPGSSLREQRHARTLQA